MSWDEADAGTFPIEYYLVEFRPPSGEAGRTVQSYVPSTATSVLRTDLERGVAYQVFVQALSGDGHGTESERKTGVTTPGIPTSCETNPGDLWVRCNQGRGSYRAHMDTTSSKASATCPTTISMSGPTRTRLLYFP